jgi:hypothetical protein
VYDVTRRDCEFNLVHVVSGLRAAFEHVTSWLKDLRAHADENVSIIRKSQVSFAKRL